MQAKEEVKQTNLKLFAKTKLTFFVKEAAFAVESMKAQTAVDCILDTEFMGLVNMSNLMFDKLTIAKSKFVKLILRFLK